MSSHLRVALAQTCPVIATPERHQPDDPFSTLIANLRQVRASVRGAAKQGVDVVVFPEYFLQGLLNEGRQYLAYPSTHLVNYLGRLAKHYAVSIVGTVIHPVHDVESDFFRKLPSSDPFAHLSVQDEADDDPGSWVTDDWVDFVANFPGKPHEPNLENTAVYIEGSTGEILGDWIKSNLWHPEREYLTAGTKPVEIFETKWGRCGFLICAAHPDQLMIGWDVSHPESAQSLVDQHVDIVFAPTYWIGYDSSPVIEKHHPDPPAYEHETLTALSYARAFETETVWIMCNAGGDTKEGYFGASGVWLPLKGRLGGCGTGEETVVVDVDLEVLRDARALYKIRHDRNA